MNYPDYLNSANLYIDGQLALENFEIPAPALKLAVDNTPMWHNYEDTHETLARFLYDGNSEIWKPTDDNQQGMRGWFEFQSGSKTAVFMVRDVFCNFTNAADPRPDDLIATAWYPVLQRRPLKKVELPRLTEAEKAIDLTPGMRVIYTNNAGEEFTGIIYRIARRLLVTPYAPLTAEILSDNRDSNGHRQRGIFSPADSVRRL